MSDVVVHWLDDGSTKDDAVRALDEWARARGVRIRKDDEEPRDVVHVDPLLAERVERELERAREAIGAGDADGADRALAHADAVLREHPELPQAAWLRAETDRIWSARYFRLEPRDEARARTLWDSAEALDGGRVPGIGDSTFRGVANAKRVKASFVAPGVPVRDVMVRLDGRPIEATAEGWAAEVLPGEHQLVATSLDGARILFAAWVAIVPAAEAPPATRMTLAASGVCAAEAFSDVRRSIDGAIDATAVACPSWIAVARGDRRGTIVVARCERDKCGPLLEWRLEGLTVAGPPQPPTRSTWPKWATWTLVGIGAATVTSVALVATGALETRPVVPRFVVGGVRQE